MGRLPLNFRVSRNEPVTHTWSNRLRCVAYSSSELSMNCVQMLPQGKCPSGTSGMLFEAKRRITV